MRLDFICVGMYRAGTTWLHFMLQEHPRIILPREKETMFFSHHYHRGIQWYEEFFEQIHLESLVGEICPTYLTNPLAIERIYKHYPNANILILHFLWHMPDTIRTIGSLPRRSIHRNLTP